MSPDDIEKALIHMLKELQAGAEDESGEVLPATVPIRDLGFFDSLLAVETTIALEARLGASFGDDTVFWNKENAEPLSISQIAQRLAKVSGGDN